MYVLDPTASCAQLLRTSPITMPRPAAAVGKRGSEDAAALIASSPRQVSPSPKKRKTTALAEREPGETDWAYLLRVAHPDGNEGAEGSVARRGIPAGSRARAKSFEVRAVDGILPLPSHQTVARAMQKIAAGEERAAAAALRHSDSASVRAFCREWHRAWGVPVPALLVGEDALPDAAAARIAAARRPNARAAPLPGRLIVVRVGDDHGEEEGGEAGGGEAVSALRALVDREFADGEALARACDGALLASYDMRVCADSAWVPGRVMRQRIEASGEAVPTFLCRVEYAEAAGNGAPPRLHVEFAHLDSGDGGVAISEIVREDNSQAAWALLENVAARGAAGTSASSVLLTAPASLVVRLEAADATDANHPTDPTDPMAETQPAESFASPPRTAASSAGACSSAAHRRFLLPTPSERCRFLDYPASLLQKAIRRSSALASPIPLLQGCRALLGLGSHFDFADSHASPPALPTTDDTVTGATDATDTAADTGTAAAADAAMANTAAISHLRPPRGGPYRLFWTVATCALNDVAPCAPSDDGSTLGVAELIALAFLCRVDPGWAPPAAIARQAVGTALRLQASARAEQWQGQVSKVDGLLKSPTALSKLEGRLDRPSSNRAGAPPGTRQALAEHAAAIRDSIRYALALPGVTQLSPH